MVDFIHRNPEIYDGAGLASPTNAVVKRVKEPKININKFDTSSLDVEKFESSVSDVPEVSSDVPEVSSDVPEVSSDVSEVSSDVSEVSSVAVERISDLEIMVNDQATERDIKNQYNDMLVVIGTTNQEKPIPVSSGESSGSQMNDYVEYASRMSEYLSEMIEYVYNFLKKQNKANRVIKEYKEAVNKQKLSEQAKLDQYLNQCQTWHSQKSKTLSINHNQESQKDIPLLTEQNLDNYIENYKKTFFLTGSEGNSICSNLLKLDDGDGVGIQEFDHSNANCVQKLANEQFRNNDLQTRLEFCDQEVEAYEKKISDFRQKSLNLAKQLENYMADKNMIKEKCSRHIEKQDNLIFELEEKQENLEKVLYRTISEHKHLETVYKKVLEKLEVAKKVIELCKKQNAWFNKIGGVIGDVIEFLLELVCPPYAIYNEKSFLNKIITKKLNPIERLVLSILMCIPYLLFIYFLWSSIPFRFIKNKNVEVEQYQPTEKTKSNNFIKDPEPNNSIKDLEPNNSIRHPAPLTPDFFVRGGSLDPLDPVGFREVKMLKIRNKLLEIRSLLNYEDHTTEKKMNPSPNLAIIGFYGLILLFTNPFPARVQRRSHYSPAEISVILRTERGSVTSGPLQGRSMNLPVSDREVSLTIHEKSKIESETQKLSPQIKRRKIQKKKQVRKYSDIVRETSDFFEQAECIQEKVQKQQKIQIRNE